MAMRGKRAKGPPAPCDMGGALGCSGVKREALGPLLPPARVIILSSGPTTPPLGADLRTGPMRCSRENMGLPSHTPSRSKQAVTYVRNLLEPSESTSNSHVYQNGSEKQRPLGPLGGHS